MIPRTYTELSKIDNFLDRYRYLRLDGSVCEETFGFDRYLNQVFYRSPEWKRIRNRVIARDNGCDLGVKGFDIFGDRIIVHHMNPITLKDIDDRNLDILFNPEYLITTVHGTHNAIHYGDEILLNAGPIERLPNDTCPWRKT